MEKESDMAVLPYVVGQRFPNMVYGSANGKEIHRDPSEPIQKAYEAPSLTRSGHLARIQAYAFQKD